ncbi:MAG: DNA alkylation repair protein [Nanoarchaeota archaeon]|nr:DNA alkylation repair protein [Nanoarchaeota archaeon]
MNTSQLKSFIQSELKKSGTQQNKEQYEKYFRHVIKFYGIKSPEFKELFKKLYPELIAPLEINEQIHFAYSMFDSEYMEDRSIGINILVKNLQHLNKKHIKDFEQIIDNHIYEWGTCDSFSGKIIGRMIKDDSSIVGLIVPWKSAKYMWRQRAACISFVNLAQHSNFNNEIIEITSIVIRNPERFAQLGVGWVLRNLSVADLDLVVNFIKKNYSYFSREGLRYAIEKMEPGLRKELMEYNKK